ncbi:hypothetical protein Hanom_Chr06g00566141 [Helianthus anomalus]
MRNIQQQAIVNRAKRNTQNPEARTLWEEELDRKLANFHMFGNVEGEPNMNQVAVPEPQLLPLFPDQPMNLE